MKFKRLAFVAASFLAIGNMAPGQTLQTLHSWSVQPASPRAGLCKGSDGDFYGTTEYGGGEGNGTVFRVTPAGVVTVLHSFTYAEGYKEAGLVEGPDGFFYGTAASGGLNGAGAIFKISATGVFSTLLHFQNTPAAYPRSELILARDGNFYGTTSAGGTNFFGTVYKVTPAGQFTLLHSFTAATGKEPVARLLEGPDGNFYGTTYTGGTNDRGTIFRVTPAGVTTVLFNFPNTGGSNPQTGLVLGADGNFYGINSAAFYRITPQGQYTSLYTFVSATGFVTFSEPILASDGFFYGTTIRGGANGFGGVFRISAAGEFTRIADFNDATYSGDFASLIESTPGAFVGVTNGRYSFGNVGTVFNVTRDGPLTVLSAFDIPGGTTPSGPLIEADGGNLFSTTTTYGSGLGTLYRVTPQGMVSTLAEFPYFGPVGQAKGGVTKGIDGLLYGLSEGSTGNEGLVYKIAQTGGATTVLRTFSVGSSPSKPKGQLVQAADGNFYGIALNSPYGSVFKITPSGTVTLINAFTGTDGKYPNSTLVLGSDGKYYGATQQGDGVTGTVFRITPGTPPTFETVIGLNGTNGSGPNELVAGPDGSLYGTTPYGGTNSDGTFFKVTPAGAHTLLARFNTVGAVRPSGAIAVGADGNFYGTTSEGGRNGQGCVYRATPSGALTVLHSFTTTGLRSPLAGLIPGPDGNFFGTTTAGGAAGLGSVFKITPAGVITHFAEFDYSTGNTPIGALFRASDNRIYGLNEKGGTGGGGAIFRIDGRPIVTPLAASAVAATSATLVATVNPNGAPTTIEFAIGDLSYGTVSLAAGNSPVTIEKSMSGLNPHTAYTYTARATNAFGAQDGAGPTFTTLNRPPEARDDKFHLPLRTHLTLPVLDSDADPDGDELTIVAVSAAQHGAVSTDGKIVLYEPSTEYLGNDLFTYTISDGFDGSATGAVTIENRSPVAVDDEVHLRSAPGVIDVLRLGTPDSDADGDALTISSVTDGEHGTVSTNGSVVTYTPAAGYDGNDTFTYEIADGFGGTAGARVRLENALPVAGADLIVANRDPITFDPRLNDTDADGDSLTLLSVTGAVAGVTGIDDGVKITYTPGPRFFGRDGFTYRLSDGSAVTSGTVTVRSSEPIALDGPAQGAPVPGQPDGTVYARLGAPVTGPFAGTVKSGKGRALRAIFAADGSVRFKIGDPAPGVPGATIAALGEPSGQAVLATLHGGGATPADNTVLYAGLVEGDFRVVARTGDAVGQDAKLKRFLSIDGNGDTVFFLVKLAGALVTPANDRALAAALVDGGMQVLLREGEVVDGKPVTLLTTLGASPGTLAEGRWRSGNDAIGVRLSFPAREQALYTISTSAAQAQTRWAGTSDLLPTVGELARAQRFGLPGFGPGDVASTAQLVADITAGITKSNDTVLFRATLEGLNILAREGGSVPGADAAALPGLVFKKFGDPVTGANGRVAFAATIAGEGVNRSTQAGLWFDDAGGAMRLLARAGDPAPGGGRWSRFESLALPDGPESGPLFTARLAISASEAVAANNDRGLWAVDSSGTLQLLLRTGQSVAVGGANQTIRSFVALAPARGSLGSARSYDDDQHVTAVVSLEDGKRAVIRVAVP